MLEEKGMIIAEDGLYTYYTYTGYQKILKTLDEKNIRFSVVRKELYEIDSDLGEFLKNRELFSFTENKSLFTKKAVSEDPDLNPFYVK